MSETLHDLTADTLGILHQIRRQIEPLIEWSRKQAIHSDDHEEGAFAHAYAMAAKAVSELEYVAERFDEALAQGDAPENVTPLKAAEAAQPRAKLEAPEAIEYERGLPTGPHDDRNPIIGTSPGETLDNADDVLRFVTFAMFRDEPDYELTLHEGVATGLMTTLDVVRAAMAYEGRRVPFERGEVRDTELTIPAMGRPS